MIMLPDAFLNYAYFWRRKWAIEMTELQGPPNPHKMLVDTTRILPSICTSVKKDNGSIITNAKVIGAGFVPKKDYMIELTKIFKDHIKKEGMTAESTIAFGRHELQSKEDRQKMRDFQKKSLKLLIEKLYFEKEEALQKMDFTKLCTIELANQYPEKPAHTWNYVQTNKEGTLLYFTPPVLTSKELEIVPPVIIIVILSFPFPFILFSVSFSSFGFSKILIDFMFFFLKPTLYPFFNFNNKTPESWLSNKIPISSFPVFNSREILVPASIFFIKP